MKSVLRSVDTGPNPSVAPTLPKMFSKLKPSRIFGRGTKRPALTGLLKNRKVGEKRSPNIVTMRAEAQDVFSRRLIADFAILSQSHCAFLLARRIMEASRSRRQIVVDDRLVGIVLRSAE